MADCLISNGKRVSAFLEIAGEDARSGNGATIQGTDRPFAQLTHGERAGLVSGFSSMGRANQDDIVKRMPELSSQLRTEGHSFAADQVDDLTTKLQDVAAEESRGACALRETREALSLKGKIRTDYLSDFKKEQADFQRRMIDKIVDGTRHE